MRRGEVNGTDAMDTISAAATAVATLDNRVPQATLRKRRWESFWSLYWCFGSNKNNHRIGHAVLVPQTTAAESDTTASIHTSQQLSIILPFAAPPSSPASFFLSEPPSENQSPTGLLPLTSASTNIYSPVGPASIFAIGPYAHETQLVSPPVFSTFSTEPSTAPYTPPPESVHLTTPASPEVPFAQLIEPTLQNGGGDEGYPISLYEFQSDQFQPGSPISHLISPCSGISVSGTASPLPGQESVNGHPFFLQFMAKNPPKQLDLDKIVHQEWESCYGSCSVTPDASRARDSFESCPLNPQYSDSSPLQDTNAGLKNDTTVVDRVLFDMIAEESPNCAVKKIEASSSSISEFLTTIEHNAKENLIHVRGETSVDITEKMQVGWQNELHCQKIRTITLGSSKEFNFDNVEGDHCIEPRIGPDWSDWSFCPMIETTVR